MIFIYAETLECSYCSYFPIYYSPGFSDHTDWSPTLKVLTWKIQNNGCKRHSIGTSAVQGQAERAGTVWP